MEPKNRTTAGLWALFLGGYSAHYFYLGDQKAKTRLLIAIFLPFMVFFYGIMGLVDAIKFFTMTDADFAAYCAERGYAVGAAGAAGGSGPLAPAERNKVLLEFKQLLNTGAITEEEFDRIKRKVMEG